MAGYIIDQTTKQAEYERMERNARLTSHTNPEQIFSWFQQMEQNNSLVNCTKFNCKFHKKHCPIIKELETSQEETVNKNILEEMSDCNMDVCSLIEEIKEIYSNFSLKDLR